MFKELRKRFKRFVILLLLTVLVLYCAISILFPLQHYDTIKKYAAEYDLDPALVCAVINTESGFDTDAQSAKGAKGLMQLMDETANWIAPQIPVENFNIFRIKEPELNIQMGCWYLHYLSARFDGDLTLMVAAYNAGTGNISKWLDDETYSPDGKTLRLKNIPYKETQDYVIKIRINQYIYRFLIKVNFYGQETEF
ncbi:MAG: lytic transglycosylase domain-containing protein [Firmicutes bacterium]|nr:lytic transglycosylase domain-containing protein [Bacillota bacterium]